MKKPSTIPISGFVNLAYEPILILECLCSNLQPFAHVNWAKSALELLVFVKNGSQLGTKCRGWVKMPYANPIPVFLCLACGKMDFGMLFQQSRIMGTCHVGPK